MFTNDYDFDKAMQEIEASLARQGVAIRAREFRTLVEVCRLAGQQFAMTGTHTADRDPTPGVFSGDDLTIRVRRWYRRRFEGMKLDGPRLLRIVVLLQNDPWSLCLPWFRGTLTVICDPRVEDSNRPRSVINIPDCFDDLPRGVREAVTSEEWQATAAIFATAIQADEILQWNKDSPLMQHAFRDLEATAFHLATAHPRNPGEARWSSLQVVEKILKAIAVHHKVDYPKGGKDGHDLAKLVAALEKENVPLQSDRELMGKIQCGPGVRYGETPVRLDEAVDVHHAVLKLLAGLKH